MASSSGISLASGLEGLSLGDDSRDKEQKKHEDGIYQFSTSGISRSPGYFTFNFSQYSTPQSPTPSPLFRLASAQPSSEAENQGEPRENPAEADTSSNNTQNSLWNPEIFLNNDWSAVLNPRHKGEQFLQMQQPRSRSGSFLTALENVESSQNERSQQSSRAVSPSPPLSKVEATLEYLLSKAKIVSSSPSVNSSDSSTTERTLSRPETAQFESASSTASASTGLVESIIGESPEPGSGCSNPYDPMEDPMPQGAEYEAAQHVLKEGINIAEEAEELIQTLDLESSPDLRRLLNEATELKNFQNPETRTIALIGNTGQGKSSLINCLLNDNVADSGTSGSACTTIVTEYHSKRPTDTAPFTTEVEYFSGDDLDRVVHSMLVDLRLPHLPSFQELQDTLTTEELVQYEKKSQVASSALSAAFEGKFTEEFATDSADGAEERIMETMRGWLKDLVWPQEGSASNGTPGLWTGTAETAFACRKMTEKFNQNCLWPFTKRMRIYLEAQVLKSGVILTDLPGLGDENMARVNIAQQYLLRCDRVLVVSNISRVRSDHSVASLLRKGLRREHDTISARGQNFQIAVVCTHCDLLHVDEILPDKIQNERGVPPEMKLAIEQYQKARLSSSKVRIRDTKKRLKFLFAQERSADVTRKLKETYTSKVEAQGGQFEVFCVSNTWYKHSVARGDRAMIRESQIPALRLFCHTSTVDAQVRAARHFLQSLLSPLLNQLALWTMASLAAKENGREKDTKLVNVFDPTPIDAALEVFRKKILDVAGVPFKKEMQSDFNELIFKNFEMNSYRWQAAGARALREELDGWSLYVQIMAWCRNKGIHQTPKRNFVNWNALVARNMREELVLPWTRANTRIDSMFCEAKRITEETFANLESQIALLKQDYPVLESYVDLTLSNMASHQQEFKYNLDRTERTMIASLRALEARTSRAEECSYVTNEMEPAYSRAWDVRGKGAVSQIKNILYERVESGAVFKGVKKSLSADMDALVETTTEEVQSVLRTTVKKVTESIQVGLHSMAVTAGMTTPKVPEPPKEREASLGKLREVDRGVKKLKEALGGVEIILSG